MLKRISTARRDSVDNLISVLMVILIVITFVASLITLKKEGFTPEGWSKVRKIVYEAIEDGIKLSQGKNISMDELIETIAQMIHSRLQRSDIPQEDKNFWSITRIKALIRPVIQEILDNIKEEKNN